MFTQRVDGGDHHIFLHVSVAREIGHVSFNFQDARRDLGRFSDLDHRAGNRGGDHGRFIETHGCRLEAFVGLKGETVNSGTSSAHLHFRG